MVYQEFNAKIFDFYKLRANSQFCTLAISSEELESIISPDLIRNFTCLKKSWDVLLTNIDGKPQYFGLLAIQCYASTLMENDDIATDSAYNLRLANLMGLTSTQRLQQMFGQKKDGFAIQKLLWLSVKEFVSKNWQQTLAIPNSSSNAWKHVRYPKFQALLNKEDLLQLSVFLNVHFRVGEQLEYSFFKRFLLLNLQLTSYRNRIRMIFEDPLKMESAVRQIFNYFHTWDGESYSKKIKLGSKTKLSDYKLVLKHVDGSFEFFLYPSLLKITPENLFKIPSYKPYYDQIKIFNEMDYYFDEFEDSRLLCQDEESYILINKYKFGKLYQYLNSNNLEKISLADGVDLFRFKQVGSAISSELIPFFSFVKRIRFKGGLKVSKKMCYLEGFGPDIISDNDYAVIFNGQAISYSSKFASPGCYLVRSLNYSDSVFEVIGAATSKDPKLSQGAGWDLKSWKISSNFDLEGGLLFSQEIPENPLKEWIRLHNGQIGRAKRTFKNILLRTINNSHAKEY